MVLDGSDMDGCSSEEEELGEHEDWGGLLFLLLKSGASSLLVLLNEAGLRFFWCSSGVKLTGEPKSRPARISS